MSQQLNTRKSLTSYHNDNLLNPISKILDSSSDISPSAPSIPSTPESSVSTTTNSRNVTPTTPSKRPRSYVSETFSSSILHRPPISEIPITTRTQPSPIKTPLVHIPNPGTVEQYENYKHPTAIKTVRLQPQLNLVHIPDTEYTRLPPLKSPTKRSTATSKLYPPLKPLKNLLHHSRTFWTIPLKILRHKKLPVHSLFHNIDIIFETFLH